MKRIKLLFFALFSVLSVYAVANSHPVKTRATTTIAVTISLADTTVAHNGSPQTGARAIVTPDSLTSKITYTYNGSSQAPTNTGTYQVIASFALDTVISADTAIFLAAADTATLTIKISPTITLADTTVVYNGSPQTGSHAVITPDSLTSKITYTYNGSSQAPTEPGIYTLVASYAGDSVYSQVSATANFTISPVEVIVILNDTIMPYNGYPHSIDNAVLMPDSINLTYIYYTLVDSVSNLYNQIDSLPTKPGIYRVIASFAGNADFSPAADTAKLIIQKLTPVIVVQNQTFSYNGSPVQIIPATVTGLVGSDSLTVTYRYEGIDTTNYPSTLQPPTKAGSYIVNAYTDENDFYLSGYAFATITINGSGMNVDKISTLKVYAINQTLYINTPISENISVYSITGGLLYSTEKQQGECIVDASAWNKGIMIVKGSSGWAAKIVNK